MTHSSVDYVHDSYLQGDTYRSCLDNVIPTIQTFKYLVFFANPEKLVIILKQTIACLFIISSINKTLCLPDEKKTKIKVISEDIFPCNKGNIRKHAKLVGNIVTSFPAVWFGLLGYRHLEKVKLLKSNIATLILTKKSIFLMKKKQIQ